MSELSLSWTPGDVIAVVAIAGSFFIGLLRVYFKLNNKLIELEIRVKKGEEDYETQRAINSAEHKDILVRMDKHHSEILNQIANINNNLINHLNKN